MPKYEVRPIADRHFDRLSAVLLVATDDIDVARRYVDHSMYCTHGAGILDTATGKLDVGFGFGVTPAEWLKEMAPT